MQITPINTHITVVTNNKLERRTVVAAIFVRVLVDFFASLRYMRPENKVKYKFKSTRALVSGRLRIKFLIAASNE